jgi:hypothetical protein
MWRLQAYSYVNGYPCNPSYDNGISKRKIRNSITTCISRENVPNKRNQQVLCKVANLLHDRYHEVGEMAAFAVHLKVGHRTGLTPLKFQDLNRQK